MLLVRRAEGTRVLYSRHGIFANLLIIVNKFDFGQNLTVQSNFLAKPFQDLLVSLFEEAGYKSVDGNFRSAPPSLRLWGSSWW